MSFIALSELKQGLVLQEDVCDINGRLLLSKGQKISEKHFRILKIWGIAEINVVGEQGDTPSNEAPIDPAAVAQIKKDLDGLFTHLDVKHPVVNEIYRSAILHRYVQKDFPKDGGNESK